jgi:hypothetical protein
MVRVQIIWRELSALSGKPLTSRDELSYRKQDKKARLHGREIPQPKTRVHLIARFTLRSKVS